MNLALNRKHGVKTKKGRDPKAGDEVLWATCKLEPAVKADCNWWGAKYFYTHIKESVKGLGPGMSSCQLGLNFLTLVLSDLVFN